MYMYKYARRTIPGTSARALWRSTTRIPSTGTASTPTTCPTSHTSAIAVGMMFRGLLARPRRETIIGPSSCCARHQLRPQWVRTR